MTRTPLNCTRLFTAALPLTLSWLAGAALAGPVTFEAGGAAFGVGVTLNAPAAYDAGGATVGYEALRDGNYLAAARYFEAANGQDLNNAYYELNLGAAYLRQGRIDEATPLLRLAIVHGVGLQPDVWTTDLARNHTVAEVACQNLQMTRVLVGPAGGADPCDVEFDDPAAEGSRPGETAVPLAALPDATPPGAAPPTTPATTATADRAPTDPAAPHVRVVTVVPPPVPTVAIGPQPAGSDDVKTPVGPGTTTPVAVVTRTDPPAPPKGDNTAAGAHPNAGVGNGHELRGANEMDDADPGKAGAHNKAGDNWAKPAAKAAD